MNLRERLYDKIDTSAGPDACWPWTGKLNNNRGEIWVDGKWERAYRILYEVECGSIPDGKCMRHLCHNSRCCNPEHLRPGTNSENQRDMLRAGRRQAICVPLLEDEEVYNFRVAYWRDGVSQNVLSDLCGLTRRTLSDVVRGISYKHVAMPPEAADGKRVIRITRAKGEVPDYLEDITERIETYKRENATCLTPSDVRALRTEYWSDPDITIKELAAREDISDSYTSSLMRGVKYTWAGGPTAPIIPEDS